MVVLVLLIDVVVVLILFVVAKFQLQYQRCASVLAGAASAALGLVGALAAPPDPVADEDHACIRQMQIVYEAIQAYRARTGSLPDTLGDLCPDELADCSLIVCPVTKRSGEYSIGKEGLRDPFLIDRRASYVYEFYAEPHESDPGRLTSRKFKELARKTVIGDRVPILTCFNHPRESGKRIYVAYDGTIIRTDGYWESAFRDEIPFSYLQSTMLTKFQQHPAERALPRAADTPDGCIDLSPFYNALPGEPWLHGHGDETLASFVEAFPDGRCRLGGREFDARAIVQLNGATRERDGSGFSHPSFPDSAGPIPVGRLVENFTFLNGIAFPVDPGATVGTISIHYESGSEASIRIPVGAGETAGMWRLSGDPSATAVWHSRDEESGEVCQLFSLPWENPHPDVVVESITLETNPDERGAPFFLAITAE